VKRIRATRSTLFGREYELTADDRPIGSFRAMTPAGHGTLRLGRRVWAARREGVFRGAWNLFARDDQPPVMRAWRPSAFRNAVVIAADGTEWEIHLGSFGNRITVTQDGEEVGGGRTTWSSRYLELEVPERWPDLWAAFSLWMAVWLARRRGAAAVAGGGR